MSIVYIYADESCLGNGRTGASPGAAAGIVQLWKDGECVRRDFWVSEPDTTNNRMAIRSAIEPLSSLRKPCEIIFCSDSQYLVKGMSSWIFSWIRQGWKRKAGAVENEELWKESVRAAARHKIEWRWVRGHAGHPMNEYANFLAIRAAKAQTSSEGLVPSGLEAWLRTERAAGRYLNFAENTPPKEEHFRPASQPRSVG